jgi:hypothetical protein
MIERRDVLKACLAAGVLPIMSCGGERPANPQATPAAAGSPPDSSTLVKAVEVLFKGMTFFLAMPHFATLRIPRVSVTDKSTAVPVAADEVHVYFSLSGAVLKIIPRSSGDPTTWSSTTAPPDLQIGRDDVPKLDSNTCGGSKWGSVKWLIDFRSDLYPDAELVPDWRTNPALAGRIELTHGELENGFGDDGQDHFTYTLPNTNGGKDTRLIKDIVRYRLSSPFVEFQLNDKSCVVDTGKRYQAPNGVPLKIGIDHVPGMWMDNTGPMNDYRSLYDLMNSDKVKLLKDRPVPRDRKACSTTGGSTGGCECCPIPSMFI